MKITKERLKQIIQEEVKRFQNEGKGDWSTNPDWPEAAERRWRRSTDEDDPQRRKEDAAFAQGKKDAEEGLDPRANESPYPHIYQSGYEEGESVQKWRKERETE